MSRHQSYVVPDGGWGWVIVFVSLVFHAMMGFIFASQSVLYLPLQNEFGHGKGVTSWILSAFNAVMVFTAPLSASLGVRYGYKAVTFAGGLVLGVGLFFSFFATSIMYLILTIGVIAGAGAGLSYVPIIAMSALYFDKKRSLAMGLSTSGYGIGSFAFPPLVALLEEEYTWRGVLLIICGCALNICVLALLMRPLKPIAYSADPCNRAEENGHLVNGEADNDEDNGIRYCNGENMPELTVVAVEELDVVSYNEDNVNDGLISSNGISGDPSMSHAVTCETLPSPIAEIEICKSSSKTIIPKSSSTINAAAEIMKRKKYLMPVEVEKSRSQSFNYRSSASLDRIPTKPNHRHYRSAHEISKRINSNLDIANSNKHHKSSTYQRSLKPQQGKSLSTMSIMLMGSIYNIVGVDSNLNSMLSLNSKTTAMEVESHVGDADLDNMSSILYYDQPSSDSNKVKNTFLKICDVLIEYRDLMKNTKFLIMIIINLLVNFTYLIPVLYIVDRAVDSGIDKEYAVMALSLYGAGNICGRILTGFIADLPCMNRMYLYFVCIFFCGLLTCLSVFFDSYLPLHNAYGFCFGALIGGYVILTPVVLVDMLGVEMVGQSYGLCLLFQGIAFLIGTPTAGWIRDITGSYEITFVVFGSFMVLSSFFIVPLNYLSAKEDSEDKDSQDEKAPLDSAP